jgi:hypothetical protein
MAYRHTSVLLFSLFLVTGCKKALEDVNEYYPTVHTTSAALNADGSVTAVGDIVSEGSTPLEAAGFCVSTSSVPRMDEGQSIAALQGGHFTVTYSGFPPGSNYYFRAWATNANGYAYGEVIGLDSLIAQPVTPPCSPSPNYLNYGPIGGVGSVAPGSSPQQSSGNWNVDVNTSLYTLYFTFGSTLTNGIFTTTSNWDPGPGEVYCLFWYGSSNHSLSAGSQVFVNQLTPTSWEITLCSCPWNYVGTTQHMTARFTCSN